MPSLASIDPIWSQFDTLTFDEIDGHAFQCLTMTLNLDENVLQLSRDRQIEEEDQSP